MYSLSLFQNNAENNTTRQALEEMEHGDMIHVNSFEDYVKATEEA